MVKNEERQSTSPTRSVEEIGRDWEDAGWKKEVEGKAVFYTKELSPSVMEKIKEIASNRKRRFTRTA